MKVARSHVVEGEISMGELLAYLRERSSVVIPAKVDAQFFVQAPSSLFPQQGYPVSTLAHLGSCNPLRFRLVWALPDEAKDVPA